MFSSAVRFTWAPSSAGAGSLSRALRSMVASVWSCCVFGFVDFAEVAVLALLFESLWAGTTITGAPSACWAVSVSEALAAVVASVWPHCVFGFVNKAFLVDWSLFAAHAFACAVSLGGTGSLAFTIVVPDTFMRSGSCYSLVDLAEIFELWALVCPIIAPAIIITTTNQAESLTPALVIQRTFTWSHKVLGLIDEAFLLPVVTGEVQTLIHVHQLAHSWCLVVILLAIEASATSDKGESGDADETLLVLEGRLLVLVGTEVHLSLILSYK